MQANNQNNSSFRGYSYPSETQLLQKSQSPSKKKIFQDNVLAPPSRKISFPSTFENVKNPMNESNTNKSILSNRISPNPSQNQITSQVIEDNQQNNQDNQEDFSVINPLDITDEDTIKRQKPDIHQLTNPHTEGDHHVEINMKKVDSTQTQQQIDFGIPKEETQSKIKNYKDNISHLRQPLPNLLAVNPHSNISQDSTKINPFSAVYRSQLTLGMQGHVCPVDSRKLDDSLAFGQGKKKESFSWMSLLYIFSMLLDLCLVCLYLTIFLPCYLSTVPSQIMNMPKKEKKICTNCDGLVYEVDLNASKIPQPLFVLLKIGFIGFYFLLWFLMGYPLAKFYLDFLLYVYKLLNDFFTYAMEHR